jgi:FAD/FMN-containing dehydrogenase
LNGALILGRQPYCKSGKYGKSNAIMIDAAQLAPFRAIVGEAGYRDDPDDLAPWLTDWRGRFSGSASAMLSPANTQQVAEIVQIAAANRIALVPQGGNSGMVAGATPDQSGDSLLLSLRRMNQVHSIHPESGEALVDAGVILQNFHDAVAAQGRRFPLTLGGKGSATMGGLVSTNAGGTQVLRHGTMRGLVLGLEAVLPDGSIYDGLVPLKKDNRGYDLKQLLIGGEGTIGIVTKMVVRTVPALIDRCVIWVGLSSPSDAYRLLTTMQNKAAGALEGFEILPQSALEAVLRHIPGTRAPLSGYHPWHALIELVQDDVAQAAPADLAQRLLEEAIESGLVSDAALSASEAQAEAFWKIRDSIAEAERAEGPALQHDISVPVAAMARFIEDETPDIEARFAGTEIVAFGHLGDGNIHFHVKAPKGMESARWYGELAGPVSAHVYDRVSAYKGSLSAEHGIGMAKLAEFARLSDPARLMSLRAIKAAFDPLNIMNPGKLVPLA